MSTINSIYDSFKILNEKTKRKFYKIIFLSILNGVFELIPMLAIGLITYAINFQNKTYSFIETYFNIKGPDALYFIVIVIFSLSIIKLFFSLFYQKKQLSFFSNLETQISDNYLDSYSTSKYSTYLQYKFPHVINQANTNPRVLVVNSYTNIATLLSELFLLLIISTSIFIYNYKITLIVFSINIIFYFLISRSLLKKLNKLSNDKQFFEEVKTKNINDFIYSQRELRVFNKNQFFLDKISEVNLISSKFNNLSNFFSSKSRTYFEFLFFIIIALIIVLLNVEANNNTSILFDFLIFIGSFFRMLPSVSKVISSIQGINHVSGYVNEYIKDLAEFQNPNEEIEPNSFDLGNQIEFSSLEFKNISFRYPSRKAIFENFNFKMAMGDFIGVYGENGKGKTTLIDILIGLNKVTNGNIILNETYDITDKYNVNFLKFGYVPQTISLFEESIKFNITLSERDEDIDLQKLKRSIEMSQVDIFLNTTNIDIETRIGDHGKFLSGGQRQRIGLARAIYFSEKILILDEPTNNLDELTAITLLNDLIQLKDMCIIVVSHDAKWKEYFSKWYMVG